MTHTQKVLVMLVIAFGLRAVLAVGLQFLLDNHWERSFLIEGDANGYWELATKIASGQDYFIHDPPRYILRMPGFPALLSLSILVFKSNYLMARLILAVVGTFACWLVYLLGSELVNKQIGLLAGYGCAFSPTLAGFSVLILSETLFATTLVISLISMLRALKLNEENHQQRSILWGLTAGGTIALACYVRPSWLLAAPIFVAILCYTSQSKKRGLLIGVCVLAGTFTILSPWMYRNFKLTGHWIITTLWDGPSLYDGLNPQATGASNMQFIEDEGLFQKLSEYDANASYRKRAIDYAIQNPLHVAKLTVVKLARFWSPLPNAVQFKAWWLQFIVGISFFLLFVPVLQGIWISRQQLNLCLLTVGPILYFSLIHAIFIGSLRYRLPVEYPLWIMAAVGLNHWWRSCFSHYVPTKH